MSDINSLIGKTKISVSNHDARAFKQMLDAHNIAEPYLFSVIMKVILLEDIDLFIKMLSIRFRTQPLNRTQLSQLSILYSLLTEISVSIGGFD